MNKKSNKFPKGIGGALKDVLLDASDEKFFEAAWDLFDQKPEVKENLEVTQRDVYAKLSDPKLKDDIEVIAADIHVEAQEFYLALGVLIGQKYAIRSPGIQKELGYLEMRMKEAGVLPLSTPIFPK